MSAKDQVTPLNSTSELSEIGINPDLKSRRDQVLEELRADKSIREFKRDDFNLNTFNPYGRGGYADVYSVKLDPISGSGHQIPVAIKVLSRVLEAQASEHPDKQDRLLHYFRREWGTWRRLGNSNKHVVPLYGFVDGLTIHGYTRLFPALVTPLYLTNLTQYVFDRQEKMDTKKRLILLRDVAEGLNFLHSQEKDGKECPFIHRDLKGANILVAKKGGVAYASITDFGSCKFRDCQEFMISKSTKMDTLPWTPPEYCISVDGYRNPTTSGDIWSFGCTILEILQCKNPWAPDSTEDLDIENRLRKGEHPRIPDEIQDKHGKVCDFLLSCWDEPAKRPTSQAAQARLEEILLL